MRPADANVSAISHGGTGRTRLPMSWPTAHQMERTVSRYWCEAGTNSMRLRWHTNAGRWKLSLTQENSGINWEIAAHANAPDSDKRTQDNVVWRAASGDGEDANDKQSDVKRPPENSPRQDTGSHGHATQGPTGGPRYPTQRPRKPHRPRGRYSVGQVIGRFRRNRVSVRQMG